MLETVLSSTDCIVCGSHVDGVHLSTPAGHHEAVGFNLLTNDNPVFEQDSTHNISRDVAVKRNVVLALTGYVIGYDGILGQVINNTFPDASSRKQACADNLLRNSVQIGNLLHAFTGLINLDEVIDVEVKPYSGHVYNLQTSTGWYIANNIISHNCRCVMIPETLSWAEITGDSSIPDTRPKVATGEEILKGLTPLEAQQILGTARYNLYAEGLPLSDMATVVQNADWGPTTRVLPLRDLEGYQPDLTTYL
jgi:hypothetical protein